MNYIDYITSTPRLVFFGDSICVGQSYQIHDIWVSRVSAALAKAFKGSNFITSNVSISGNTTRKALDRIKFDLKGTCGCDVFYIQFGLNDANHWVDEFGLPRTSAAAFKANMIELCERALSSGVIKNSNGEVVQSKSGAKKIFIGTNHPVPAEKKGQDYVRRVKENNAILREISDDIPAAVLIDHEKYWEKKGFDLDKFLLADGIHLSKNGHDAYLDLTKDQLIAAMLEIKSEFYSR